MTDHPDNDRTVGGRYRLIEQIGRGGMGVVWRARDEVLAREVAVKEVRAPASLDESDVARLYSRLEREAWAAGRITHRNVVTIYDVANDDGRPWIVMELVRGLSLAEVLEAEGPLPPARVAAVGAEVLSALRSAHEAGVLHRDVKPSNILIANDGRVILTDFGIAMIEGGSAITMTGEVIGSPEYLAPEQALGQSTGPASDLWSLGVTMYAAVEGRSPFRQNTPLSTLRAVVDEELPTPVRAAALAPVLAGLLHKDPAGRLPANEAEGLLRLVAAGGTPRTATAMASAAPHTPAAQEQEATPNPALQSAETPTGTSGPAAPRRPGVAFVIGLLILALGAGGITWVLLNRDDPGGVSAGANGTSQGEDEGASGDAGGGGASETGESSAGEDEGKGESPSPTDTATSTATASPSPTPPPSSSSPTPKPLTVSLSISAEQDSYVGACPPVVVLAPRFSGTITLSETSVELHYRWVSESGRATTAWRNLDFVAGGSKSRTVELIVDNDYTQGDTYQDSVALEVDIPQREKSEYLPFTITCEPE